MNSISNKTSMLLFSILIGSICITPLISAENNNTLNQSSQNISINNTICELFSIQGIDSNIWVRNGEKISYTFGGWQTEDEITYWIEDVFGRVWKNEYTSMNNNKKTYTTNIQESDRVLILKAKRKREGCELAYTEAMFIVIKEAINETGDNNSVGENETQSTENETLVEESEENVEEDIKILAYDDELSSGNKMHIELFVQKNSNRNNAFYVWLENEEEKKSGEIKINIHQKGTYTIEIELPIKLDVCGNAFQKQYLHFSGLGKEKEEKVYILEEACEEKNDEEQECSAITISNDIILEENPLQSLYVRAQNWQENISLYSSLQEETMVWVLGPIADKKVLQAGTNSISINPRIGNNTYALVTEKGQGKIIQFTLKGEENTLTQKGKETKEENMTMPVEGYYFPATDNYQHENKSIEEENKITSQVIYTTKKKGSIVALLSIIFLSSIGIIYKEYTHKKRKALIRKNHSKKVYG